MAVITPLMVFATAHVHTRTIETGVESTISPEENTNSQLLDKFLESCTKPASTHHAPAKAVPSKPSNSPILTLPLTIIKEILRHLLTSPHPLFLQPDLITTAPGHRTYIEPSIIQVCKALHNIGVPILYGENTLTSPSPATSYDFDVHLLSLPGGKRQMVSSVKLEIDWADRLWAKFPLVARALGELKALRELEIVMVGKEKGVERNRATSIEKDAGLNIVITYSQAPRRKDLTARQRVPATDRAESRIKREWPLAHVVLKAEMKMLRDLVTGIKGLKDFRLTGFRDEAFAKRLEERVRMRNR